MRKHRAAAKLLDRVDCLLTLARLTVIDRLTGPPPESPTGRPIRERSERLRRAFPWFDERRRS